MLVEFKLASNKDKKPTVRILDLYPLCNKLGALPKNKFVKLYFFSRNGAQHSYTFKSSREDLSGASTTLYGFGTWDLPVPLPTVRNPITYNVTHVEISDSSEFPEKIIKPRPQPFPQDFLGNSLVNQNAEKLTYPVNQLDEKMERLVAEINAALVLAGGHHKGDHSAGKFTDVMRNLLSNVDKKTLVKIVENAYI